MLYMFIHLNNVLGAMSEVSRNHPQCHESDQSKFLGHQNKLIHCWLCGWALVLTRKIIWLLICERSKGPAEFPI